MASLSELADTLSRLEGLDPSSVALIARYLREAGLVTKRGRGLAAAQMTVADAANLLIAVNTSRHAAVVAAKAVGVYRRLTAIELLAAGAVRLHANLGRAVELLISAAGSGILPQYFLRRQVPEKLQEAFTTGLVHIELKFQTSAPGASIRIMALESAEQEYRLFAEGTIDIPQEWIFSLVFLPPVRPRIRRPDRKEETTIGYRTLQAVGKLIG